MLDRLYVDLADGDLRLVKLTEAHREALRAACAADADVWTIYSSSFGPDHFDKSFDALIGGAGRMPYAILDGDRLVDSVAGASRLAALGADAPADGRERVLFLDELERLGVLSLRRELDVTLDADVRHYGTRDYIADFVYRRGGAVVIEDAKGVVTDVFRIKAKLMAAQGQPVTIWRKRK